jgi:hypothetical protein
MGFAKESAQDYVDRLKNERSMKKEGLRNCLTEAFTKYISKHGNIEFNNVRDIKDYLYTTLTLDAQLKHEINKLSLKDDELLSLFQESIQVAKDMLAEEKANAA